MDCSSGASQQFYIVVKIGFWGGEVLSSKILEPQKKGGAPLS